MHYPELGFFFFNSDDSLEIKIELWGMFFAWISDSVRSQVMRWQRLCYAFTAICSPVEYWLRSKGLEYIRHMVKQLLRRQREANLSIMLRDGAEGRAAYVRLHRLFPPCQPLNGSATVCVRGMRAYAWEGQPEGRKRVKEGLIRRRSECVKAGEMIPERARDESWGGVANTTGRIL